MRHNLFLDEHPLLVFPTLARIVGLNEAIFLQQLHYWLKISKHHIEGKTWVYNTVGQWQEQFPFWSEKTLRRIITSLENNDLIETSNQNQRKFDKTKWYTINYEKIMTLSEGANRSGQLDQTHGQNDHMDMDNLTAPTGHNDPTHAVKVTKPIPEITTTTTNRDYTDNSLILNYSKLAQEKGVSFWVHDDVGYWKDKDGSLYDHNDNLLYYDWLEKIKAGL